MIQPSVARNAACVLQELLLRLNAAGIPTEDISGIPTARLHLRHVVGGSTLHNAAAEMAQERLFEVDVPERIGTIRRCAHQL